MADNNIFHTHGSQHVGGNFAGISAGCLPVAVLSTHADVGALCGFQCGAKVYIWGADNNVAVRIDVYKRQDATWGSRVCGSLERLKYIVLSAPFTLLRPQAQKVLQSTRHKARARNRFMAESSLILCFRQRYFNIF